MLSPLTGLIDAANTDAPNARIFNRTVDEMIADNSTVKVKNMLNEWRDTAEKLAPVMENSAALAEAKPLHAAGLIALGLALLREISGEAKVDRAQQHCACAHESRSRTGVSEFSAD